MTELWLKYKDETGEAKRLLVEQENFAIGRHSENDLSIANSAISRQHAKIQRFADIFVVSDAGSSLGTRLNGEDLTEPVALKKGDRLKLGDNFEIEVELISDSDNADDSAEGAGAGAANGENEKPDSDNSVSIPASGGTVSSSAGGSSISSNFFYIAPLLGLFVLLSIGGIFLATGGGKGKEKEIAQRNEVEYKNERRNSSNPTPEVDKTVTIETPVPTPNNENSNEIETNTSTSTPEETNSQPPPKISGEMALIEKNSAVFLRKIAEYDPKTFLNGKQQELIKPLISQYKGSAGLAENIRSIKRNKTQIESLAQSYSLKPLFLANIVLARLDNRPGDVLATAQSMVEILGNLKQNIGAELSEDCLLIVAAYQPSIEGKSSSSSIGVYANLTKGSKASASQVRTIWFLKEKDKITNEQFNFALRFLAVGTISQNPKEFGVNAEAIIF